MLKELQSSTFYSLPAPIGYLKVTNVTFTKAELSWTCPEIGDSLVRFDVRVVVDENDKFTKVIQGDKHRSMCLVNLTPDSLYTISVRYVTTEGPGPYSIPISFKAMKGKLALHSRYACKMV
ncbi:hypothetical protein BaRGS_00035914 [Batillaria attramentaria]|uniref:Fibronectin type-III domain-containing protein n=1 Tax=Batillaria attramentaria TaxID=370345 RepID=A0ABD0JDF5_9CAEN